jgi:hypothetical protein
MSLIKEIVEELKNLHIRIQFFMISTVIVMPFWFAMMWLFKRNIFIDAPIYISIVFSYCISVFYFILILTYFLAQRKLDAINNTNKDALVLINYINSIKNEKSEGEINLSSEVQIKYTNMLDLRKLRRAITEMDLFLLPTITNILFTFFIGVELKVFYLLDLKGFNLTFERSLTLASISLFLLILGTLIIYFIADKKQNALMLQLDDHINFFKTQQPK